MQAAMVVPMVIFIPTTTMTVVTTILNGITTNREWQVSV